MLRIASNNVQNTYLTKNIPQTVKADNGKNTYDDRLKSLFDLNNDGNLDVNDLEKLSSYAISTGTSGDNLSKERGIFAKETKALSDYLNGKTTAKQAYLNMFDTNNDGSVTYNENMANSSNCFNLQLSGYSEAARYLQNQIVKNNAFLAA